MVASPRLELALSVPGEPDRTVISSRDMPVALWSGEPGQPWSTTERTAGMEVTLSVTPDEGFTRFLAEASIDESASGAGARCYLSLVGALPGAEVFTFNGPAAANEVYRQSPHDPGDHTVDIVKQAVPMVAFKTRDRFYVVLSDAPAFSRNYTTQTVDPATGRAAISSGDSGAIPGQRPRVSRVEPFHHEITPSRPHRFEGVLFESRAEDLQRLRDDVFRTISLRWGSLSDRLGRVAFATNYMHLRHNETGNSRYWICPGIEYANKQYSRDAFWQSMVLSPEMEAECYRNEAVALSPGAERPLFTLIWSYRIGARGGEPDLSAAQACLEYIESHMEDGWFYSHIDPGKKDFQSWYDLCAFETDDVVSYNQGLTVAALIAANELGLDTKAPIGLAERRYRSLYDEKRHLFPLSRQKDIVSVDPLVGDLVSQLLFGRPLLDSTVVAAVFETLMSTARTEHGFKITCELSGDYVACERYSARGFRSRQCDREDGAYANGGSYYLYDMLFLIDCYLHGVEEAEEQLIWRTRIEFERGGTYHEYLNTRTGVPGKANQGWNGAVYAIWRQLMAERRASDRFLREIDESSSRLYG